jgi:hypothetical protein
VPDTIGFIVKEAAVVDDILPVAYSTESQGEMDVPQHGSNL